MSQAIPVQPASRHPPKRVEAVLAEAEAQWLFKEEELSQTPSILDGMTAETEKELRMKGLTLSTAAVFFNRFLMRYSLVNKPDQPKVLHHYQIAATALFLATKTEENIRRMKELIVACCRVAQKNPSLLVDEQSKDFWRWRDTILFNEDVLLEKLCFDLTVESPHKILFDLLKFLGVEHNKKLRNAAWAFVNDSSLTMVCLRFSSRTIAAGAVYCGLKHCQMDPRVPEMDDEQGQPWWVAHGINWKDIQRSGNYMTDLYENNTSKQSSGEQSIYVGLRTPIADDEDEYRDGGFSRENNTLSRQSSQTPPSPGQWTGPADVVLKVDSERGVKRVNGEAEDESERVQKKPKTQVNGVSSDHKVSNSKSDPKPKPAASAAPAAPAPVEDPEAGSEEGEVEE